MKRPLVLLIAVIVVAIGGYLLVQGELPFGGGGGDTIDTGPPSKNDPQTTSTGSRVTDTRPNQDDRQPVDTDLVRLRYRVVDARSGKGIAGARILHFRDGTQLAETDDQGHASLTGIGLPFLVFSADDYLLNHYQPREPDTEELLERYEKLGYVEARLEPDRFTVPFGFRFVEVDGKPARKVTFRIVCVDDPKPGGRSVPISRTGRDHVEPEIRRAWEKHHRLCLARPGFTRALVHLGVDSDLFDFECDSEATVRFVATGYYAIIARSAAGGFRDREFQVVVGQREPFIVHLQKGLYLRGQVLGPSDEAVPGARLMVKEKGLVVHMAQSDAGGRFRIGPWNQRQVHLEVTQNWYLPRTVGPVMASEQDIVVRLAPRPVERVSGVVRRRPGLQPVAGARVVVWVDGVEEATTTTDEQGRFAARSPTKEPQLHIRAKGFLPYKEIVSAAERGNAYDLLPETAATRVSLGLTALLSGTVIGSDGKPAVGEPVQIMPREPPTLPGISGRRILEGGSLKLSRTVFTDQKGGFTLEWDHAGEARLIAVKGLVPEDAGQYVNVVLGKHHRDIRLILAR